MPPAGEKPPGERRRVKPLNPKGNGNGKAAPEKAKGGRGSTAGRGTKRGVKNVARLRIAVENGTYRVEARKVADKIVKDAVREIRSRLA